MKTYLHLCQEYETKEEREARYRRWMKVKRFLREPKAHRDLLAAAIAFIAEITRGR